MEEIITTPPSDSNNQPALPIPQITLESLTYLRSAGQWAKFLAILGFIAIGFMLFIMVIIGITINLPENRASSALKSALPLWLPFIYVILVVIYVVPVIYLNNFANNIKKAVNERETGFLTDAFLNIKRHYKYLGIAFILGMISYFVTMSLSTYFITHNFINHPL